MPAGKTQSAQSQTPLPVVSEARARSDQGTPPHTALTCDRPTRSLGARPASELEIICPSDDGRPLMSSVVFLCFVIQIAASVRFATPSFRITFLTWTLTVASDRPSSRSISPHAQDALRLAVLQYLEDLQFTHREGVVDRRSLRLFLAPRLRLVRKG